MDRLLKASHVASGENSIRRLRRRPAAKRRAMVRLD